jgi:putative acetyltransferase
VIVREETAGDVAAIGHVNLEAFKTLAISNQTEHLIVEALRDAGALEISLVAEQDGAVVGHIAFSRATIGDASRDWYLLGPVAVLPALHRRGIGSALVEAGLERLRERGARGCALVGDPAYYNRLGFIQTPGVTCPGVPDENVLCLRLGGTMPEGELRYHPAFLVEPEGGPCGPA